MRKRSSRTALRPKSRFRSGSAIVAAVALVAFGYAAVRIFAASGNASLYLTPAIGTYAPNQAVNVQIYTNTGGDPVNAVQANFTYSAAQLQFNSIDGTGSAFGLDAYSTGGSGTVSIARATNGGAQPVTGVGLIATVHFTALAAGSAALAFQNTSHVVRSTDNMDILTTTTGATYTIAVASTPTPTPGHTPTPAPGHSSTPTPTAGAGAGSPSPSTSASPGASASPSTSVEPHHTSTVVTVPTTKVPKKTDVLGVKLAGIPVLALAAIVVLAAGAGVVFFMSHNRVPDVTGHGADQAFKPSSRADDPTPPSPPAQAPSSEPIMPQTPAEPPAPSEPSTPADTSPSDGQAQPSESQDKDHS